MFVGAECMEQCIAVESTERLLVDGCARGEAAALEEIVRIYGGSVLGYLNRICGNREEAEDLFQETFKRVYEKARTMRGDRIKPWLFRMATNAAIDRMRRKRRLRFISLGDASDCHVSERTAAEDIGDPVRSVLGQERKELVARALMQLPEKMKATVVMAYYEGLDYQTIADCMGCSVGTVKTQMFRAMRRLAAMLPGEANAGEG
jgi:RNA polymerase sigma-70 factor (ECF subfamily)